MNIDKITHLLPLIKEELLSNYDLAGELDFYSNNWVLFIKSPSYSKLPNNSKKHRGLMASKITNLQFLITNWVASPNFMLDWNKLDNNFKYDLMKFSPQTYVILRSVIELVDLKMSVINLLNIEPPSELDINPNIHHYLSLSLGFTITQPENLMKAQLLSRKIKIFLKESFPQLTYNIDFTNKRLVTEIFFLAICKDFLDKDENEQVKSLDMQRTANIPKLITMVEKLEYADLISSHEITKVLFYKLKEHQLKSNLLINKEKKLLTVSLEALSCPPKVIQKI